MPPIGGKTYQLGGILLTLGIAASSCGDSGDSELSVSADYLRVTGSVRAEGGPIPNTRIFAPGETQPLGRTGPKGRFDVTINDATLGDIKSFQKTALHKEEPTGFRLRFQTDDQRGLAGRSRKLKTSMRGDHDLKTVTLEPAATLTGRIQIKREDGTTIPGGFAFVIAGDKQVQAGAEGRFKIKGLPPGETPLTTGLDDYPVTRQSIRLEPGKTRKLSFPLTLFPEGEVAGLVHALPPRPIAERIKSGHPYGRRFVILSSDDVALMRYHHDRKSFDRKNGASWQPVTKRLEYDFPGGGGHNLYVQFASEGKNRRSPVLTVKTGVDLFADADDIVIGDGSGIIRNRQTLIHLNPPAAAKRVRCHHKRDRLMDTGFEKAREAMTYEFPAPRRSAGGSVSLYCQFADDQENLSLVQSGSATLRLFPRPQEATNLMSINGGSRETDRMTVSVRLQPPSNAEQMRFFEGTESGSPRGPWQTVRRETTFRFSSSGTNHLFVQFRDPDGTTSPAYGRKIRILPYGHGSRGFTINDGGPSTPVRDVTLNLHPPDGARSVRIAEENGPPIEEAPWQPVQPQLPHTMGSLGQTTVYVQYRNTEGRISRTFAESIHVDPFYGNPGSFRINGGAQVTASPYVDLQIEPPIGAVAMLIEEQGVPLPGPPESWPWIQVSTRAQYELKHTGPNVITVRFKTLYGDVSPGIQRTIVFAP